MGRSYKSFLLLLVGPEAPFLVLLYINDLPGIVCYIGMDADDTSLYSKCDQASNL